MACVITKHSQLLRTVHKSCHESWHDDISAGTHVDVAVFSSVKRREFRYRFVRCGCGDVTAAATDGSGRVVVSVAVGGMYAGNAVILARLSWPAMTERGLGVGNSVKAVGSLDYAYSHGRASPQTTSCRLCSARRTRCGTWCGARRRTRRRASRSWRPGCTRPCWCTTRWRRCWGWCCRTSWTLRHFWRPSGWRCTARRWSTQQDPACAAPGLLVCALVFLRKSLSV